MAFLILAAGIILIFLGIRGRFKKAEALVEDDEAETGSGRQFESLLSENLLVKRLDRIDEKLSLMEEAIYEIGQRESGSPNPPTADMDTNIFLGIEDINKKITILRSEGFNVEEIASQLNITKGEVLLRLGMRK